MVKMRAKRTARLALAAAVALAIVLPAERSEADESLWHEIGMGAGAGFSNLLYVPAKAVYAGLGGVVGGITWCVTGGDTELANGIWNATMNGTWAITPAILEGRERLEFNARPAAAESSLREYEAPTSAPTDTYGGDAGYGEPAPRYDDHNDGSGGTGWQ